MHAVFLYVYQTTVQVMNPSVANVNKMFYLTASQTISEKQQHKDYANASRKATESVHCCGIKGIYVDITYKSRLYSEYLNRNRDRKK